MNKDLRQLRQDRNMSVEELAYKIGASAQSIHNWERGEYKPRRSAIIGLAYVLGCKPDEIIFLSDITSK